ncbi:MAG: MOSC domain-containing protein [Hyphomicrobium sp.]
MSTGSSTIQGPTYIASVQAGRIAPLGPTGVSSAFVKRPIEGPIRIERLGLAGDEQADRTVHGGPDKAVYGYARANYNIWRGRFPEHAQLLQAGGFGENLTIDGLDETTVCIGDIMRAGTVALQVSEPRQPCFKLALRFGDRRMPKAMMQNGLCGWYFRVLEPGQLTAGNRVRLEVRLNPDWTIARFHRLIAARSATLGDMAELAHMEGLARHWREMGHQTLSTLDSSAAVP